MNVFELSMNFGIFVVFFFFFEIYKFVRYNNWICFETVDVDYWPLFQMNQWI